MPPSTAYSSEAYLGASLQDMYMLDHDLHMPLKPYSHFDYARYNSFRAQGQYSFPVRGPELFSLDHSIFGKTMDVAPAVAPLEYVGYYINEPVKHQADLGKCVVVERAEEEE
jgi:hypothetical protein